MALTIKLSTPPNPSRLRPVPINDLLTRRLGTNTPESTSLGDTEFYSCSFSHPVFDAAAIAFSDHLPLTLRPDDFWLMISQGFAAHVTRNAEKLRHKFVAHEGQPTLVVYRDEFVRGNPQNDWAGVFREFSGIIAEHIGETHQHIVPTFSTTTSTDSAAFEVTLLEAMSQYFQYEVHTRCGIPSIHLAGEKEDWEQVLVHTRALAELDREFGWWTGRVIGHLEAILSCFTGEPSVRMWDSFFKKENHSGNTLLTGWLLDFVPYLQDPRPWMKDRGQASFPALPSGLSTAPFVWQYLDKRLAMKFVAGHLGVTFHEDRVQPVTGWAIVEDGTQNSSRGEVRGWG